MKPIFIIEHLEPKLWEWCLIEYKHISRIVGKKNVWFTNIRDGKSKLKPYGGVFGESVRTMKLANACVLDPDAKELLNPVNAAPFQYFIFGGILGEEGFNWRTKKELTRYLASMKSFHLGDGQFSTDNAVYVTKQIIEGRTLGKMPFLDTAEIELKKGESVILPYRYPLVKGKPHISRELVTYLKNKKSF